MYNLMNGKSGLGGLAAGTLKQGFAAPFLFLPFHQGAGDDRPDPDSVWQSKYHLDCLKEGRTLIRFYLSQFVGIVKEGKEP